MKVKEIDFITECPKCSLPMYIHMDKPETLQIECYSCGKVFRASLNILITSDNDQQT